MAIQCPSCGKKNKDDAEFCSSCGCLVYDSQQNAKATAVKNAQAVPAPKDEPAYRKQEVPPKDEPAYRKQVVPPKDEPAYRKPVDSSNGGAGYQQPGAYQSLDEPAGFHKETVSSTSSTSPRKPTTGFSLMQIIFIAFVALLLVGLLAFTLFNRAQGAARNDRLREMMAIREEEGYSAEASSEEEKQEDTRSNQEKLAELYSMQGGVTDPFLKPALELFFEKPADQITLEELSTLRYLKTTKKGPNPYTDDWTNWSSQIYIGLSTVDPAEAVSAEAFAQSVVWTRMEMESFSTITLDNLYFFQGLKSLLIDRGLFELEHALVLPDLEHLSVSGSVFEDFSQFEPFPKLRALEISGGLDSLAGIDLLADRLQMLSLTDTDVSDFSPIAKLPLLETLQLEDNEKLTSLAFLRELNSVRSLRLCEEELKDYSPLSALTGLESLSIEESQLKLMPFLSSMPNLKTFVSIENEELLTLAELEGCTALEVLELDAGDLKELPSLAGMTNLRRVVLDDADDLSALSMVPQLEELELYGCMMKNSALHPLTELKSLTLRGGTVEQEPMTFLTNMSKLEKLDLSGNTFYAGIGEVYALPALVDLNLSGSVVAGDFQGLARLSRLQKLQLDEFALIKNVYIEGGNGMYSISYDDVEIASAISVVGGLENLQWLSMRSLELTDISFVKTLHALTYLDVSDNYLTDLSPAESLEGLTALRADDNPL